MSLVRPLARSLARPLPHSLIKGVGGLAAAYLGDEDGLAIDFTDNSYAHRTSGGALFRGRASDLATLVRASQAGRFNSAGVFEMIGNNLIRFDYNPATRVALGARIEEQRTNLQTYSAQFDNAAWTKTGATISADAVVGPDGTTSADKLVENTANSTHSISSTSTGGAASTPSTFSVFAKAAERSKLRILNTDNATGGVEAIFDLAAGTVGAASVSGNYSSGSAAITDIGDGSYRCSVTATKSAAGNTSIVPVVQLYTTTQTYLGDGVSGAYVWGGEIQVGAFVTSHIPTVASQVTRAADVLSVATADFPFSVSEGTVVFEGRVKATGLASQRIVQTGGAGRLMYVSGNQVAIYDGTTEVAAAGGIVGDTDFKAATAYGAADGLGACFNGGVVATGAFDGAMAASATMYLGSDNGVSGFMNGHFKRFKYLARRASDAELQAFSA